jgi:peptide/nickel transport system ATP-binding protein
MLLRAEGLRLALPDRRGRVSIEILRGVDLELRTGEALGIVGESGSGKTSLGRTILRLYEPTAGKLSFADTDITHLDEAALRPLRARMQLVFQDPQSALNPRHRIRTALAQPFRAFGWPVDDETLRRLLARVGLREDLLGRFPHQLSGGQRQRVGIARAIALEPALIVADEITSGLDVSSKAQILALLRRLRAELGMALIFISHDLGVVRALCDRVAVMRNGAIVEQGACEMMFAAPKHPQTRELLEAIPLPVVEPGWLDRAPLAAAGEAGMDIAGCIALVTGANRGIGAAYVEELLARGAAKVYAAARAGQSIAAADARVVPMILDITDQAQVDAAAVTCGDVTLLVNNAGVNFNSGLLAAPSIDNARLEIETNYLGTLRMCRAFAPVLGRNGGGGIVNMISILALVQLPLMGSLCASKAALWSLTQGVRAELAKQGTLVVGVLPGAVETRMTEGVPVPKIKPAEVATAALEAVVSGTEEVYPSQMAQGWLAQHRADPKALEKELAAYLPS